MSKRFWLLAVLLPSVLCTSAIAQLGPPRIIDCHIHYNGDPEFLHKLITKLASVDGLAFLLVPPADLGTAKPVIDQSPNRLIGFGSIDVDDPRAVELVDEFHAAGFRG